MSWNAFRFLRRRRPLTDANGVVIKRGDKVDSPSAGLNGLWTVTRIGRTRILLEQETPIGSFAIWQEPHLMTVRQGSRA